MQQSTWHTEIWTPDGDLVADFSGRVKNRSYDESRNEAEIIQWAINLDEIEEYCRKVGTEPDALINPGINEIRIRHGSNYLGGGQITYANPNTDGSLYEVRGTGFLNLFKDRRIHEETTFDTVNPGGIPASLITASQTGANRDFGVTIGATASLANSTKIFKPIDIKAAIQETAKEFNFDFRFSHDKVFSTYQMLGSIRAGLIFEYPGNIINMSAPLDATNIQNSIEVLGSGAGEEAAARVVVEDTASQEDYKVRESALLVSDIEDEDQLTAKGQTELAAYGRPFRVPILVTDANVWPFVTDYSVGDYIKVINRKYQSFRTVNGLYRVEKRHITVDENDVAKVKLYVSL
jgi:hypothetical protein